VIHKSALYVLTEPVSQILGERHGVLRIIECKAAVGPVPEEKVRDALVGLEVQETSVDGQVQFPINSCVRDLEIGIRGRRSGGIEDNKGSLIFLLLQSGDDTTDLVLSATL
jgi:hypothetical protein